MILSPDGVMHKWKIDTGKKVIETENNMGLNDYFRYHGCAIYGNGSTIGVYDNGPDKGAACIHFRIAEQKGCSECVFGKLEENEFYKAERIKPTRQTPIENGAKV